MRKFIFDVDGTLTPSRSTIDPEFGEWFADFCSNEQVFIVTGGSKDHTVEQIGNTIWNLSERAYQCSGNQVWMYGNVIRQNEINVTSELIAFFDYWIENSMFPYRTGNHVDIRPGLINLSTIGRGCSKDQRADYVLYDRKIKERETIAKLFNEKFGPKLVAQVAGETGIDIVLNGKDKSQIIHDFDDDDELYFFGDKMDIGGNDYPLGEEIRKRAGKVYHVKDWMETWNILKDL